MARGNHSNYDYDDVVSENNSEIETTYKSKEPDINIDYKEPQKGDNVKLKSPIDKNGNTYPSILKICEKTIEVISNNGRVVVGKFKDENGIDNMIETKSDNVKLI